jgi:hypothetical protein
MNTSTGLDNIKKSLEYLNDSVLKCNIVLDECYNSSSIIYSRDVEYYRKIHEDVSELTKPVHTKIHTELTNINEIVQLTDVRIPNLPTFVQKNYHRSDKYSYDDKYTYYKKEYDEKYSKILSAVVNNQNKCLDSIVCKIKSMIFANNKSIDRITGLIRLYEERLDLNTAEWINSTDNNNNNHHLYSNCKIAVVHLNLRTFMKIYNVSDSSFCDAYENIVQYCKDNIKPSIDELTQLQNKIHEYGLSLLSSYDMIIIPRTFKFTKINKDTKNILAHDLFIDKLLNHYNTTANNSVRIISLLNDSNYNSDINTVCSKCSFNNIYSTIANNSHKTVQDKYIFCCTTGCCASFRCTKCQYKVDEDINAVLNIYRKNFYYLQKEIIPYCNYSHNNNIQPIRNIHTVDKCNTVFSTNDELQVNEDDKDDKDDKDDSCTAIDYTSDMKTNITILTSSLDSLMVEYKSYNNIYEQYCIDDLDFTMVKWIISAMVDRCNVLNRYICIVEKLYNKSLINYTKIVLRIISYKYYDLLSAHTKLLLSVLENATRKLNERITQMVEQEQNKQEQNKQEQEQ